jgi:hypothetical protein
MKARPIIMRGDMVRATLDHRKKSQTRREIKPQPYEPDMDLTEILCQGKVHYRRPAGHPMIEEAATAPGYSTRTGWAGLLTRCPFGQPGDRLWVRETWNKHGGVLSYRADGDWIKDFKREHDRNNPAAVLEAQLLKWVPSIHMPRWASRLTLEITAIRIERLQDITEEDAKAEGSTLACWFGDRSFPRKVPMQEIGDLWSYKTGFANLWESVSGAGSWDKNPWVWVINYKVVENDYSDGL